MKTTLYKYLLVFIVCTMAAKTQAQSWVAEGITYQGMLLEKTHETYGATLKNIPVINTNITVKFNLSQGNNPSNVVYAETHNLVTNEAGIFACIIGQGSKLSGTNLRSINWGKDSTTISVFIDQGKGFEAFSSQKLWSSPYALHAYSADFVVSDKDTSATNEIQRISLVGDSIKLSKISGGISIQPILTQIADSKTAITAANAEITALKNSLTNSNVDIKKSADSITIHRSEINKNATSIAQLNLNLDNSNTEITNIKTKVNAAQDSISRLRGDVNTHATQIATSQGQISTLQSDVSLLKNTAQNATDSIAKHRTEINNSKSNINKLTADLTSANSEINNLKSRDLALTDSIAAHRSAINGQANKLTQLNTSLTTAQSNISSLQTSSQAGKDSIAAHRTELNNIRASIPAPDNMGNHTATKTLDINNKNIVNVSQITTKDSASKGYYIGTATSPRTAIYHYNNPTVGLSGASVISSKGALLFTSDNGDNSHTNTRDDDFVWGTNGLDPSSTNYLELMRLTDEGILKAKTINVNNKYTLPTADGTNGQIITTNGAGTLSWSAASSGGASKLDDLSDVVYNTTNFTGSILIGHQTTGTLAGASYNTGIGQLTLSSTKRSSHQVAIGYSALSWDTGGTASIAIGPSALRLHQKANYQIAIGRMAMGNTTGYNSTVGNYSSNNIAIGDYALSDLAGGKNCNVAIGTSAMSYHQGAGSIGIGWLAGFTSGTHFTGDYVTLIGAQTGYVTPTSGSNNTYLGYQAKPTSSSVSNEIVLGNTSISSLRCQVSLTTVSDARVKENIQNDVAGLNFIMNLRPVTYNYNIQKVNKLISGENYVDTFNWTGKNDVQSIRFSGFLAQEVEQAALKAGYEFSGVDKPKDGKSLMGLRYSEFVVPLVKGMQEQQAQIEKQKSQIQELTDIINKQNALIENMNKRLILMEK